MTSSPPPDDDPVDAKAAFYFRHREQIEEWAALRQGARRQLEDALAVAMQGLTVPDDDTMLVTQGLPGGPWPRVGFRRRGWRPAELNIAVSLGWNRGQLLTPSGTTWPFVGLHVPDAELSKQDLAALRTAVRPQAVELGWTRSDAGWVWWQTVPPEPGEFDVAGYADHCLAQLRAAWPVMAAAVSAHLD